ncbi:MAG: hemin transporter HemP [Planctomyces sp.]|nr:hemin transporter HemP [Planctomyces sp.]
MPGSSDPQKSDTKATPQRPETLKQTQVPSVPLIQSSELMGAHKEIQIQHGSELYRLCLTKSGKLILHK